MGNIKYGSGLRITGHVMNPDRNGCSCGARPEGWDKSIPVRDWHREHKLDVSKTVKAKEAFEGIGKTYLDNFIRIINADHDDNIVIPREIACDMRNEILRLRARRPLRVGSQGKSQQ